MNQTIHLDIRQSATVKINLNNQIEYASEYMLEILEYDIMEFVTQAPKTLCHPDMPEIIHNTIGELITGYKEGIAVLKHITKTGKEFWAFTHYKPSYKPDGSFEAFVTRRKPLPHKKLDGSIVDMKYQISKLYQILKDIELHTGLPQAEKYLNGFLEYNNYNSLNEYYMSFFDFKKDELEKYFSINETTPQKTINKYLNVIEIY